MRPVAFRLKEVTSFPQPLDGGVLYVSERFSVCGHLCACGCGKEVILPLNRAQWSVIRHEDGAVTLAPSVANTGFPCNSHYVIRRGQIEWHAALSKGEAALARNRDKQDRTAYLKAQNSWWRRIWRRIRQLF